MAHKNTHQLAEKVKKNREDRRNKERQRKERARIHAMRSVLGRQIQRFRQVADKLDLCEPHESVILNKMIAFAESDPRFLQEDWGRK